MRATPDDHRDDTQPLDARRQHPGGRVLPSGAILNGTYEIRALLGEGGMGQVFEAHDRLLNRRVAVKVAWPEAGVPSVRKEAQALAVIQHPSLPQVHAFGIDGGCEYVVMERVHGVSLHERMQALLDDDGRFSIAEVVALVRAVAEALRVVHGAGIVHRDVKPSNIMLAPRGRVVLMDFGTVLPACDIERDKRVMGTPEYVAPEAIRGQLQPSSAHLVDLYALGVLAFELLTGEVPFAGASPHKTLLAHLEQVVPDVRHLRPEVPAHLAKLVQDLLAKSPEDRPDAEEVLWRSRSAPPLR